LVFHLTVQKMGAGELLPWFE